MSTYAAGFNYGERQAYLHRKTERLHRPARMVNEYQRGFWDGYTPRTAGWDRSGRKATEADTPVCQEAEHA